MQIKVAMMMVMILLLLGATARAQSPNNDPAASAMARIQAVIDSRIPSADRALEAARHFNESVSARKQGDQNGAVAALERAERIVAEIDQAERGFLLDELSRAIALERSKLFPKAEPLSSLWPSGKSLTEAVSRSAGARFSEYRDLIAPILAEENVPIELISVAMVESRFNPLALSPKGARGIWQFMPETARRYGLIVQPMNDHRTNPELSTRAAARYLRDLYQQFRDWPLALAAYNAGEARIQRIIEQTGIRSFAEMARRGLLPLETRQYVPGVLAVWARLNEGHTASR